MSKSASVGQSAAAEKFRVKRSFTDEFKQSAVRKRTPLPLAISPARGSFGV
jgi:hypothetical protein